MKKGRGLILSVVFGSVSFSFAMNAGAIGGELVWDPWSVAQEALTTAQDTTTATNAIQTAYSTAETLKREIQNLTTISPETFGDLNNNLQKQLDDLNNLKTNENQIAYTLNSVVSNFNTIFPSNASLQNKNVDASLYNNNYQNWSQQLQSASYTAMQSQSIVNDIKSNNQQAQSILKNANDSNNDGAVAQLQSVNEMLGVVNSQLSDVATVSTTAGRLAATAASSAQAKEDEERAALVQFTTDPAVDYQGGHGYNANDL